MTNQQYPITPPPELIDEWIEQFKGDHPVYVAIQAAQWGADQELEACIEWFQEFYKTESWVTHDLKHFCAARRPKPPSLKEQALEQMEALESHGAALCNLGVLRRALEALDG